MDYLENALRQRKKELEDIISKAKKSVSDPVEGYLRIAVRRGTNPQYHWMTVNPETHERDDRYLKKDEADFIRKLAQQNYTEKIIRRAEKQQKHIQELIDAYDSQEIIDAYERLNDVRKQWIKPLEVSDETFAEQWQTEVYTPKAFAEEQNRFKTEKGEYVRSKSEKIIADYFLRSGIPYKYEKPLLLKNRMVFYPDFTLLNSRTRREYYYEHFGMMDNEEYANNAVQKIKKYQQSGYLQGVNLLFTFETRTQPLDMEALELMRKAYLE